MENSKLIQILKSLSRKDLTRIDQFVNSPYFNKNLNIIKLMEVVLKAAPSFSEKNIRKEKVFKKVFPGEKYDDLKLRHISSDAYKLVEKYLVHQRLEDSAEKMDVELFESFREKDLEKNFTLHLNKLQKKYQDYIIRDGDYFFYQYKIQKVITNFHLDKSRTKGVRFQEAANNFDKYYLINKLKLCCEMLNVQNVVNIEHELILMEEILDHLKKRNYEDVPAIAIYYNILMTLINSDIEENFQVLKRLLREHSLKFPVDEGRDMYFFAINFCIKKLNQGNRNYLVESFNLYKEALEKNILFEDGYLSQWNFKNIVSIGLLLEKFEWVKSFIWENKTFLQPEVQENSFNYNLAIYYYYTKNYKKSVELLQKVEYNDIFYALDSKSTLIKAYYELDEVDALLGHLDNFKVFLNRNKKLSYHKGYYLKLIKYVKKLLDLPLNISREEEDAFNLEVANQLNSKDAQWIMQKIKSK